MPMYDYKCADCQHKQTITHPMNDKPTIYCPNCSKPMSRAFGVGAVTFKGTGWGHQA